MSFLLCEVSKIVSPSLSLGISISSRNPDFQGAGRGGPRTDGRPLVCGAKASVSGLRMPPPLAVVLECAGRRSEGHVAAEGQNIEPSALRALWLWHREQRPGSGPEGLADCSGCQAGRARASLPKSSRLTLISTLKEKNPLSFMGEDIKSQG